MGSEQEKTALELVLMTDGPDARKLTLANLADPSLNQEQRTIMFNYIADVTLCFTSDVTDAETDVYVNRILNPQNTAQHGNNGTGQN